MTTDTELSTRGSGVTESEPTPTPHSAGSDPGGVGGAESTRTRARVRARISIPAVPDLHLRGFFVRDEESPLKSTFPRCKERVDYSLRGTWTVPPEVDAKGRVQYSRKRIAHLVVTVLIACPFAIVIDLLDWASFPLGRLAGFTLLVLFVALFCL